MCQMLPNALKWAYKARVFSSERQYVYAQCLFFDSIVSVMVFNRQWSDNSYKGLTLPNGCLQAFPVKYCFVLGFFCCFRNTFALWIGLFLVFPLCLLSPAALSLHLIISIGLLMWTWCHLLAKCVSSLGNETWHILLPKRAGSTSDRW